MPTALAETALTTVAYMLSEDGGQSWHRSNSESISLPATADTVDVIASGSGKEGRVLNAGSLDVSPDAVPHIPYSVQVQNSSQAYLATPLGNGIWRHQHLNPFLPGDARNASLLMYGGIAFGSSGDAVIAAVAMDLDFGGQPWGEPSSEVVAFHRPNGQNSFRSKIIATPDPESPRWLPNLERRTGFNTVPKYPSLLFTDGQRGSSLDDRLNNHVYWVPGTALSPE